MGRRIALAIVHRATGRELHSIAGLTPERLALEKARLAADVDRKTYLIQRRKET